MKSYRVDLTKEEARAFELMVNDPGEWISNVILNKVRKCFIYLAEEVARDVDNAFSPEDRAEVEATMLANGDAMKQPKQYSQEVKNLIAAKAKMKTKKERDDEELARMVE